MFLRAIITASLGFVTAVGAHAQKDKTDDPAKALEYFIGDWDVSVTFRLPDGKDGEGKAACKTGWVVEGKFLQQEYKGDFMGSTLTVVQMFGYDAAKKKFVEFQYHSGGDASHTIVNEGAFNDKGKVLTFTGDTTDGFTGRASKLRTVTIIADRDNYTLEWYMTKQGGKEERKVVLTHKRK